MKLQDPRDLPSEALDGHPRPQGDPSRQAAARFAWKAALLYGFLGILWILFSDRAVEVAVPDRWEQLAQSLKGTAFILGSSLFILVAVRSYATDHTRALRAERETQVRARQQAAVAQLGQLALTAGADLDTLFEATVRSLTRTLDVGFSKVLRLRPDGSGFELVAGVGWAPGLVGKAVVPAGLDSQAGYTLRFQGPVVVEELTSESRFSGPRLLVDHRVVSGVSVLIGDPEDPWGVLGVHSKKRRAFSGDDVAFLTGVANVLASAVHRVRVEAALRESESRFRHLVEAIPAVTFIDVQGLDTASIYVSPQIRDLLGIEPRDWLEGPPTLWRDMLHPDDARRVIEDWEASMESGSGFVSEYRMVRPDGQTIWVRECTDFLPNENGPALIQGVFFDITDQKESEVLLAEAEARYRTIVETTPAITYQEDASVDYGSPGAIVYVSPQVETILGFPPEGWVDPEGFWAKLVHPDDLEAVLAESVRTGRTGEPYYQEYRMIAADGRVVWVRDEAVLIRDEEGQPSIWQGVILDITETKTAEERLRRAEERYRNLVEATPGVVYVAEPGESGAWYFVSPQVERLLGFPPSHWTDASHRWFDHIHEDDRARVAAAEERSGADGARFVDEYRMIDADGRTIWVRDAAEVVHREADRPLLWGTLYDITESKKAESDIRRFAARLEALHDLDRSMLSATSRDELLGAALDRLRQLVPCDRAAVRLFDVDRGVLRLARAWQRDGVELQIPEEVTISDPESTALLDRELFLVRDLEELGVVPDVLRPFVEAGVRSGVGARLAAEGRPLGYLIVMSRAPDRFDEGDSEIVEEFANELALAISQADLREALDTRAAELQVLADERQVLLGKLVAAQEEERSRVARELHDGLGQTLTAISLRTGAMEMRATPETKADTIRLRELATLAVSESRKIVWGLRPPDLDTLGFVGVLRRAAADLASRPDVKIEVHVGEEGVFLPSEAEPVVFRILQEALNNAVRHAAASTIRVDVLSNANAFVATVVDDGTGFDPSHTNWGVGMISMRERAEVLGATLDVDPRPQGGTIVRLRLGDGRMLGNASDGG